MKIQLSFPLASFPLALLLLPTLLAPAWGQAPSRVSPASLPLPLPTAKPLPPDRLRAENPWNLSMTGPWQFHLTHGRIVAGQYVSAEIGNSSVTASSSEDANPPENAFDGKLETRWCASDDTFPQSLQADLGQTRSVTGVTLHWERAQEKYRCRIEDSLDGKVWKILADLSAAPGLGDGPVALTPTAVRYVRVTVVGSLGGWASLRECDIRVTEGGVETSWRPPPPAPVVVPPDNDTFAQKSFPSEGWDTLAVPSNWEMAGYSLPTYNSVDNTVGLYRRWVVVPKTWSGKRVYWHFDGALDGAEVFVNGQKAGYHESGYTAFDVDLTGLVNPGKRNLFAVRVSKSTPSDDCETGDFQAMGGIYRDTSLIAVPQTHIHDITVRTPLTANYRDATLTASVQVMGKPGEAVGLTGNLVGVDGQKTTVRLTGQGRVGADGLVIVGLSVPVQAPKLWSAEKPNLYYLVLQLTRGGKLQERTEQRFGFRQVEIKNDLVLWNGKPIKCTGVCRHDFWADKGFALTEQNWQRDLALLKAANVNAVRTSHYNHAARFLELCEEKGLYILDEVPFCWIGDKVKDPAFLPPLMQRATETLGRDKNRPCVLAWSIGNENPYGEDEQKLLDMIKQTDPTRPAFVSCLSPTEVKGQDWLDAHYPDPSWVDSLAKPGSKWPANFSEHPHIFYQKETQDYDPGASDLWSEALAKTWDKLWSAPSILGSFIWEWQNQGIADKNANRTRDFYYGKDRLRQENDKGIVDAYRTPKPEWWIVKMVYSPVVVGTRTVRPINGVCTVPLTNHYSFTDLSELSCRWTALQGTTPLRSGLVHIACAPMQSAPASFPAPAGMTALRLEFDHADGTSVTVADLAVQDAPLPAPPSARTGGEALAMQDGPDTLRVSSASQEIVFDKHTGAIQYWRVGGREMLTGGPVVNLGEGKKSGEKDFYQAALAPVTEDSVVLAQPQPGGGMRVSVTSSVLTQVGGTPLGGLVCVYTLSPDAEMAVHWSLHWTAPETHLWESGLKLTVPAVYSRLGWSRDSFFTAYPPGHLGEPNGTALAGEASFRSSKRSLHWMALTTPTGTGLTLLASDTPLVSRADPGLLGTTLFASREVSGPRDFSGSWVSDHDILATPKEPLSGSFVLRATGQ